MPTLKAPYTHCLPKGFHQYGGTHCQTKNGTTLIVTLNNGVMTFPAGFWWNGANYVPYIRSADRGSLVHDVLCLLGHANGWGSGFRLLADREIYCIVRADGGIRLAETVYWAVRGYQKSRVPGVRHMLGAVGGAPRFLWGLFRKPKPRPWCCGKACPPNAKFDYRTEPSERPSARNADQRARGEDDDSRGVAGSWEDAWSLPAVMLVQRLVVLRISATSSSFTAASGLVAEGDRAQGRPRRHRPQWPPKPQRLLRRNLVTTPISPPIRTAAAHDVTKRGARRAGRERAGCEMDAERRDMAARCGGPGLPPPAPLAQRTFALVA